MDNVQKQQQVTDYKTALNAIVLKMEQNELDASNNVEMTSPPYILRQDLLLLTRNIGLFIASELPELTKDQHELLPTTNTEEEYTLAGTSISSVEAATLNYLRFEVEDTLKTSTDRFNQHLINLRPNWYPNRPNPISF